MMELLQFFQQGLMLLAGLVLAPLLGGALGGLLAAVIAGMFNAQDTAISVLGRLLGVGVALMLFGPSIYSGLEGYMQTCWELSQWLSR